jgi:hypothetical protein
MDPSTLEKLRSAASQALAQGKTPEEIRQFMLKTGYSEAEIAEIMPGAPQQSAYSTPQLPAYSTPRQFPDPSPQIARAEAAPAYPPQPGGRKSKKKYAVIALIAAIAVAALLLFMMAPPGTPGVKPYTPPASGQPAGQPASGQPTGQPYTPPGTGPLPQAPSVDCDATIAALSKVTETSHRYTSTSKGETVQDHISVYELSGGAVVSGTLDGKPIISPDKLITLTSCNEVDTNLYLSASAGPTASGVFYGSNYRNDGEWFKAKGLTGSKYWQRLEEVESGSSTLLIDETRMLLRGSALAAPGSKLSEVDINYYEIALSSGLVRKHVSASCDTGAADIDSIDISTTVEQIEANPAAAGCDYVTSRTYAFESA